jgi:hypothetical protein
MVGRLGVGFECSDYCQRGYADLAMVVLTCTRLAVIRTGATARRGNR